MEYSPPCGAATAAATICDGTCKTFLICSNSKKNEYVNAVFLFHFYDQHIPPRKGIKSEVIWSNGLSSKFKNRLSYAP